MLPFIIPNLSEMQAGFRKGRGCRDNITILITTINHLLQGAERDIVQAVIPYIDFTAAFDSISHSYLTRALKEYGVPVKYCRLVKAIYKSAEVRVRLQEPGGHRSYSRNISIKRGVIQGDIPSPVCFLVALDKLLKDHGMLDMGITLTHNLSISELEYADDAAIPCINVGIATDRLTHLDHHAKSEAGMAISIPKTKVQHIMRQPKMASTTEEDIANLPPEKQFKFNCEKCGMNYPTKHGLAVCQGRWCKKRKNARRPSRTGTVADRLIKRYKTEKHQEQLPKVQIRQEVLENVYSFVYLGAEIASDGDPEVTIKHRINIAWGRFGEYRQVLSATKLPVSTRIRLYRALIVSTMTYGCCAWLFTAQMRKKINGVNSKMLSQITQRSIHQEAAKPTFDIVDFILKQRWEYLGHILRLDHHRALKRFLLELSPSEPPFHQGSMLADTNFRSIEQMIEEAANRDLWRKSRKTRQVMEKW